MSRGFYYNISYIRHIQHIVKLSKVLQDHGATYKSTQCYKKSHVKQHSTK